MKIHQIIFCPTGGTQRVSESLCQGMGKECVATDLCVKAADIQLPDIHEDDLAVIAIPRSDPKTVDTAKCISCMKCVSVCPTGARSIGVVMNFLAIQGLKKVCAIRKGNELYV